MADSPQMASLKSRYGVTTQRDLLRAIRDENNEMFVEAGEEKFTLRDAEVFLDRELEAEFQRIEGGAYDRQQVSNEAYDAMLDKRDARYAAKVLGGDEGRDNDAAYELWLEDGAGRMPEPDWR